MAGASTASTAVQGEGQGAPGAPGAQLLLSDISIRFEDGTVLRVDALASATLMTASPVFHKMLTHDMKEKERSEIELPGKDPKQFETLLKFLMPSAGRKQKLSDENVGFLRKLCEEYMIETLREECVDFIRTAEPSTKVLVAAHALNLDDNVRRGIDELLGRGIRDWGECYGDSALMQKIIERTMTFLQGKESQLRLKESEVQAGMDQLRLMKKKLDGSQSRLQQAENQLRERDAHLMRTYR